MAKIVMKTTIDAAPHNVDTRSYSEGEEYEIGSDLMPEWLADALIDDGHADSPGRKARKKEEDVVDLSLEDPTPHAPGPKEVKVEEVKEEKEVPKSSTHNATSHTAHQTKPKTGS